MLAFVSNFAILFLDQFSIMNGDSEKVGFF